MTCRLEYTDDGFVWNGVSRPGLPQIVDSRHQFVEPFCRYLRHLFLREGLAEESVRTYAEALLHLCNFIERRIAADAELQEAKRLFDSATNVNEVLPRLRDGHLEAWLASQVAAGNKVRTRQQRCDTVFICYCWLETVRAITYCVRIPGITDGESFEPALSSKPARTAPDMPKSKYGIISALRPRSRGLAKQLPIPTDDDIEKLLIEVQRLFGGPVAERNTLLIRWYRLDGLRRIEWIHLKVKNIPSADEIDGLMFSGLPRAVELDVTKGGHEQSVDALPDLLVETREYIDGTRRRIVKQFTEKYGRAYKEPEEIFLSEKTGKALNKKSVSNLLRRIFDAAGVKGHGHRLRATFATHVVNAESEAEEIAIVQSGGLKHAINHHNVELRAADKTRHADPASLKPYVDSRRKQRSKSRGHDEYVTMDFMVTEKRQRLAVLNEQVAAAERKLSELDSKLKAAKKPESKPREAARHWGGPPGVQYHDC